MNHQAQLVRGLHGEWVYVLPAGHPFLVGNGGIVRTASARKRWRVEWRDFLGMR